ncbi:potassium-transporting ATPase subunit KdpC [Allorhizobium sp. BGMRC 0089]|uniref:potassium-transporting ATPase subunit KdpC n=1 Tax=Allorhizobium sonneratiae TaxID=2934936 RepID=UPI0020343353|nr:potassium-transporting ATPase subunit KdpC [Allorhizobium sonneratiae]MCM2292358.1 potassium-transporting ATPase subunit KdpC [Allorhizobium sonneratiae]
MLHHLRPALTLVVVMTALTGLAYPLAITGIAETLMPAQANGSLIEQNGKIIGSQLIGQSFTSDRYFWSRPSATSPDPYNADSSSGSNLGPTSAKLRDRVAADVARLEKSGIAKPIPADAVTTSGSGLDPDISPAFARAQIARVAKARSLDETKLAALVDNAIEKPAFGFIGEPRVNVLALNLSLDHLR